MRYEVPLEHESVAPLRQQRHGTAAEAETPQEAAVLRPLSAAVPAAAVRAEKPLDSELPSPETSSRADTLPQKNKTPLLKRGHALTYAGLFLFTTVLYFRPYELIPALAGVSYIALGCALFTIAVYIPSQLALEGTLTAKLREVKLVLLLCLAGLLSIPLAIRPDEAWATFTGTFFKAVLIFVVIVNVARTERRLMWLIFLTLGAGVFVSLTALDQYRLGNFTVEGYRVKGALGGIFDNPNDMAIHLISMVPIGVALFFSARNFLKKLIYGGCTVLLLAGTVVTFSRGAFLGLSCAIAALTLKLGRRNRLAMLPLLLAAALGFFALAPSNYTGRLASIFDHSLDPNGSASTRQQILTRSIIVALRHPLFGIGMGNFHIMSIHELVSHNSYTQVASEMGLTALVLYVMFMVAPLRRLRQVERETFAERRGKRGRHFYYLAVGLQASLIAYMVSSFFGSVAYMWYVYYLVGYAVCLRRLYESESGRVVGESTADGETVPHSQPASAVVASV
ncbi:MAG: O-antigen ligase family protein [Pyrinomonadaceae bacterium]|nr:O-antigen ligase family protein [Pyrinomonadaceae bacterium]